MTPPLAAAGIAVLVVIAISIGLVLRRRDGTARRAPGSFVRATDIGAPLGRDATLVQFSTSLCARCPGVRRLLGTVSETHDGVTRVDVDLTHRADLARRFGVLQTPTTLVVDAHGAVSARFAGVPTRDAVERELAEVLGEPTRVR